MPTVWYGDEQDNLIQQRFLKLYGEMYQTTFESLKGAQTSKHV